VLSDFSAFSSTIPSILSCTCSRGPLCVSKSPTPQREAPRRRRMLLHVNLRLPLRLPHSSYPALPSSLLRGFFHSLPTSPYACYRRLSQSSRDSVAHLPRAPFASPIPASLHLSRGASEKKEIFRTFTRLRCHSGTSSLSIDFPIFPAVLVSESQRDLFTAPSALSHLSPRPFPFPNSETFLQLAPPSLC